MSFKAADLFKNLRTARTNTAFKRMTKQLLLNENQIKQAELEVSNIDIEKRQIKSILKVKKQKQYPFNIYNLKNEQIKAISFAIEDSKEAGVHLTDSQIQFLQNSSKQKESKVG